MILKMVVQSWHIGPSTQLGGVAVFCCGPPACFSLVGSIMSGILSTKPGVARWKKNEKKLGYGCAMMASATAVSAAAGSGTAAPCVQLTVGMGARGSLGPSPPSLYPGGPAVLIVDGRQAEIHALVTLPSLPARCSQSGLEVPTASPIRLAVTLDATHLCATGRPLASRVRVSALPGPRNADLHECADPPCGVAPLVRPAAGHGPCCVDPAPRPQAPPGPRPIRPVGPQKPLFRRFCPRVSSPISRQNTLFRPVSVFSHTVLYMSGTAARDAARQSTRRWRAGTYYTTMQTPTAQAAAAASARLGGGTDRRGRASRHRSATDGGCAAGRLDQHPVPAPASSRGLLPVPRASRGARHRPRLPQHLHHRGNTGCVDELGGPGLCLF